MLGLTTRKYLPSTPATSRWGWRDGTVVLALRWDYAEWIPAAERLMRSLQKFGGKTFEQPKVLVAISGVASPKVREELAARQIKLADGLAPGH